MMRPSIRGVVSVALLVALAGMPVATLVCAALCDEDTSAAAGHHAAPAAQAGMADCHRVAIEDSGEVIGARPGRVCDPLAAFRDGQTAARAGGRPGLALDPATPPLVGAAPLSAPDLAQPGRRRCPAPPRPGPASFVLRI